MRALLDVNVLIALLDPDHIQHRRATDWLAKEIHHGWAPCPITQNGCLRIMLKIVDIHQHCGSRAPEPLWRGASMLAPMFVQSM